MGDEQFQHADLGSGQNGSEAGAEQRRSGRAVRGDGAERRSEAGAGRTTSNDVVLGVFSRVVDRGGLSGSLGRGSGQARILGFCLGLGLGLGLRFFSFLSIFF